MQWKRSLPRWTIHEQFFQKATLHDTEHLHKGLMWPREWQENRTLVQKPVDGRKMAGLRNDNSGLKGEKEQRELEKRTEDQHSGRLAVQETGTKPQVWWGVSGEVTSREGYELTQRLFHLPKLMCRFYRLSASPDSDAAFLTLQHSGSPHLPENTNWDSMLWKYSVSPYSDQITKYNYLRI